MRVAQVTKPGANFELVERDIPPPGRGQVRVRVQACGICHSDLYTKEGHWPGIRRLRRAELPIDTIELARNLIGKTLVHHLDGRDNPDGPGGRMSGRIVEAEAYVVGDAAGHAFRGQTPRNRSLFLRRGHAYVYFTYGSSWMLNVSSETPGIGAGVLLRAIEPLEGIAAMECHRGTTRLLDLARGPGRLAAALRIDKRYDGLDLCARGPLWLGAAVKPAGAIGESVRIGITREVDRLLRFFERGNPFVSGPRRLNWIDD
ncbi:MAG: DNA-3-methyladenine glycosylase [Terriglobia bacterium]